MPRHCAHFGSRAFSPFQLFIHHPRLLSDVGRVTKLNALREQVENCPPRVSNSSQLIFDSASQALRPLTFFALGRRSAEQRPLPPSDGEIFWLLEIESRFSRFFFYVLFCPPARDIATLFPQTPSHIRTALSLLFKPTTLAAFSLTKRRRRRW